MAWRRYPKYEKKLKSYKDYTHLTFKDITNKRNHFLTKKEEINITLEDALNFEKNVKNFASKIYADPQMKIWEKELNVERKNFENINSKIYEEENNPKYKSSILNFLGNSKKTEEKQLIIKNLNKKKEEIRIEIERISNLISKSVDHNEKKIPIKIFKIFDAEFRFDLGYGNAITNSSVFNTLRDFAKKNIEEIDKSLEPINKAFEIIKKRHFNNEQRVNKAKEEASRYKAQAYAHQQKTRDLSEEIKKEIKDQENIFPVCPYCEQSLGLEPHADHIYPVTLGGLGTKDNMVYVCSKCNQSKGALTLREFVKKKGLDRDRVENNLSFLGKKF